MYCDEQSPRATVDESILLAGQAHGWSINDGHHLCHVLTDKPVEQVFVAILNKYTCFLLYRNYITLITHILSII